MCGRYNIIPDVKVWVTVFGLSEEVGKPISNLALNYNVAPTQDVPIIRINKDSSQRELVLAHWGLIPFWATDVKIGYRMINARAETVAEKPAFRAAFRKHRCLIPISGFYEWRKNGSAKQPYLIRMKDERPFALAGLWERWRNREDGTKLESCTIIVTGANQYITPIHDRMPVILSPKNYSRWLDPDAEELNSLLTPCPNDWLHAYPVSTYVNIPRNNDARCIERVEIT